MAALTHIARPYALAAFDAAREKNQLVEWTAFLQAAVQIARDPVVIRIAANPETLPTQLHAIFNNVLTKLLTTEQDNFLRLLAQNRRLLVLPEIANGFNACCEQLEKISKVRVITAVTATAEFQKKLAAALTKRIKRDVTLHCEIDPSILGGAVIHMGDNVIDGSIRGKLTRLLEYSLR